MKIRWQANRGRGALVAMVVVQALGACGYAAAPAPLGNDAAADAATDTATDAAADAATDAATDTATEPGGCDLSTGDCPCSYHDTGVGVCGTAMFNASGVCQEPTGFEATETSCDGLDNDCDWFTDEGCAQGAFVLVPAGTFTMGSPAGELSRGGEEVQHEVTLTRSFYLQETEVTQGQWTALMGADPSAFSGDGEDRPVETVNWWQALAYANAESAAEGLPACYSLDGCTGMAATAMSCTGVTVNAPGGNPYLCTGYRLPTEAEWEYAYRAGTTTAFYNGDITDKGCNDPHLDAIGWYCGNADETTHPAGQQAANAWGLYDMAGNVSEWVWDCYGNYPTGVVADPTGPETGPSRVFRGGSWGVVAAQARAARRDPADPGLRFENNGLRLARTAP